VLLCLWVLAILPLMESQAAPQGFSHDGDCPLLVAVITRSSSKGVNVEQFSGKAPILLLLTVVAIGNAMLPESQTLPLRGIPQALVLVGLDPTVPPM